MDMFLFYLLVIYSVPKRKNSCMFWCDNKIESFYSARIYRNEKCKCKADRCIEDMEDNDDEDNDDGYGGSFN